MFYLRKATCSLLLIVVLNLPPAGQTVEKSNSNEKLLQSTTTADSSNKKTLTSVQQYALLILDPLFVATNDLEAGINKVYIQAQIADTLWGYDEPSARRRFEEVFRTINSIERMKPANEYSPLPSMGPQLRANVLKWIIERDPAWARQLALNYLNNSGQNKPDIWMVMSLADTDPPRAAQIMKQILDKKEGIWLEDFLIKLRQKDSLLADDLFSYALMAGPQKSSSPFDYFLELFDYVFPNSRDSDTTTLLSPKLIKQFLDFGYRALMEEADKVEQESKKRPTVDERAGYGYLYVVRKLPFFDKYMPDAAPKILARWDEVILTLQGGKEHIRQINLLNRPKSVQDILGNAEQAKDKVEKQALYALAAQMFLSEGNFDQALSILNRIDKDVRLELEQHIRLQAAESAIARGNIDTAYRYSKEVKDLESRVHLLNQVTQLLQDKKEIGRAMEVINETEKSIEKAQKGPYNVGKMLMILASAAARLNSARGFEVMRSAIEAINSAKNSDGIPTIAISFNDFDQNLLLLAQADFDQALRLAKSIMIKEASILAQVAACRGVLLQK